MKALPKYRLVNQRKNGYTGNYKKLFDILDRDSVFIECAEESLEWDGDDMIIETSWSHKPSDKLPKGIIHLN